MERVKERNFCELRYVIAFDAKGHVAAGYDKAGKQLHKTAYGTIEEVEVEIVKALESLSGEFVSLSSGMNLFKKAFPAGFIDPFYMHFEGDYKRAASTFAQQNISEDVLVDLLAADDIAEISRRVRQCFSKTNLLSQFEAAQFNDFLKDEVLAKEYAGILPDFLYGDDFEGSFKRISSVMERGKANKWTTITYLPFLISPEQHMFMKPEVTQKCAERMAFDLDYDAKPNVETYDRLLKLADYVLKGTKAMDPKDNIDVQSFFYVVGNEDYISDAIEQKEAFENAG